jgi:hypothetical protein
MEFDLNIFSYSLGIQCNIRSFCSFAIIAFRLKSFELTIPRRRGGGGVARSHDPNQTKAFFIGQLQVSVC